VKTRRRLHWMLLLSLLFSSFAFATFAAAAPLTEQQKIDALIHSVEVLPGAQFIRNGSAHDGKAAADHLQQKRRYVGDRIKTANDFISCCASKSSMSGQPYQIRYADGKTVDAEVYFRAELKRIETPPPAPIVAPSPAPIPAPAPARVVAQAAIPVSTPSAAAHSSAHSAAVRRHAQHHPAKSTDQKRPS
jgi:hypothetical protein